MTVTSWQKWGDLLVDYGQQLYVPWALSEGQVLYRDVYYLYGPLSSYLHSLVFQIFGPGIFHLAIFNIILIALFSVCIYRLIERLSDSATATLATTMFLGGFAFGYYVGFGLFTYVCPYSYELTHGVMLSVLALYHFMRYVDRPSPGRIVGVGLLLGLVYLTKAEVFLAIAVALGVGGMILLYMEEGTLKAKVMKLGLFLLSFLLPIFLFAVYFAFHMPVTDALRALVSPWANVFNSEIPKLPFYQLIRGTYFWQDNVIKIALYVFVAGILITGLFYWNLYLTRSGKNSARPVFYSSAVVFGFGIILYNYVPWLEIPRSFPFILLGYGIYTLLDFVKYRDNPSRVISNLPFFVFALFSFVLTLKVILNLKFSHFGFVLALPATLAILVMLLHFLPQAVQKLSGSILAFRSALFSFTGLVVLVLMFTSHFNYMIKQFPVGEGPDRLYDFSPLVWNSVQGRYITRGMITKMTLEYMDQNIEKDATFAAFPDAIMFNYLTRHKTSTKDTMLEPVKWILVGDVPVLNRLKKTPPHYVLFVHRDYSVHGHRFFGKDFSKPVFQWIVNNYSMMKQFGPVPFTDQGFGIQIWKRKSDPVPHAVPQ